MCVGKGEEVLCGDYIRWLSIVRGRGGEKHTPPKAIALLVMVRGIGWNAIVPITPVSRRTSDVVL